MTVPVGDAEAEWTRVHIEDPMNGHDHDALEWTLSTRTGDTVTIRRLLVDDGLPAVVMVRIDDGFGTERTACTFVTPAEAAQIARRLEDGARPR
jgi:hypothetical protein